MLKAQGPASFDTLSGVPNRTPSREDTRVAE
jgi:hypothetical protein